MQKRYLAHRAADGREQTVLAHLQGTAALAEKFASEFGAGEQGKLSGLGHDLGKYSAQFQKRILGDPAHVDHSTAGAWECFQRRQISAAFAIAGHHGGLPDWGSQTDLEATFQGRINKAALGKLPDYSPWKEEVQLPGQPFAMEEDPLAQMFFTRMLYSCLVDADYLDTEAFMEGKARASCPADMELLWQRLKNYIAPWFPPKTELNAQRCAILQQCMDRGAKSTPGLFTLTVPTGGGKTVASLAFALAQARSQGLRRIIYVIPYTSIIEQTADIFRTILGAENVLEHHSGVLLEGEETLTQAKATENWDMPVIVTTAVQFFESLFASRSSQCRKIHNIARSVVIFDEAQMLPLPYLRPCVFAISQLVKRYGVSAVLCTATQPALGKLFREFLDQAPRELCPPEICRWEEFRRVCFQWAGELSWEAVADRMNSMKQVLTVVNTRKNAQQLYGLLKGEGAFHLSTLMCPEHRRQMLQEIRSRLQAGLPCRVVSTSLIEAGVDVDFPTVFREETGLDSILQAAGRCNREGKHPAEESIVTVFKSPTLPPPMNRTAVDVSRKILNRNADLNGRDTIRDYFRELLEMKGPDTQDQKGILPLMEENMFPFRTVSENFHLIDNNTQTVYIPFHEEACQLLAQLRCGQTSRGLYRKLGRYSVNVYAQHFQSLPLEILPDGSGILLDMERYSQKTGLSLDGDRGQALFI